MNDVKYVQAIFSSSRVKLGSHNAERRHIVKLFDAVSFYLELQSVLLKSMAPRGDVFASNVSKLTARSVRTESLLVEAFATSKLVLVVAMGFLLNLIITMGKRAGVPKTAPICKPVLADLSLLLVFELENAVFCLRFLR